MADLVALRHRMAGQRVVHVQARIAKAHLPHDAMRKAQLAVRAGADAQVVAELPVVEVVRAAVARARVGRYLVARPCPQRGALGDAVEHRVGASSSGGSAGGNLAK